MKKRILVRHENLNGAGIVLQRKSRLWYTFFLVKAWRRWRLLNSPLFKIEQKIATKTKEIEKLLKERAEEIEYLARENKTITAATTQTYGYGIPFFMVVNSSDLRENPNNWPKQPSSDWQKIINPRFIKGRQEGMKEELRDKVGAGQRRDHGQKTAYVDKRFSGLVASIDETGDYDTVLEIKENNNNQRRNKGNNNQNNNQNNRGNNNYDD